MLGLSSALLTVIDNDAQVDHDRVVRRLDELTSRAMKLNSGHPLIWEERAVVLSYLGQWDSALEASAKSGRIDPYGRGNVLSRSRILANAGAKPVEALALVEQSIASDPPGGFSEMRMASEAHLLLGQYTQAIARCEKVKGLWFDDWWVDLFLAAAYAHHGDTAKAATAKAEVQRLVPGYSIARLKSNGYSVNPAFIRLAEEHFYSGLRKAGIPENWRVGSPRELTTSLPTWRCPNGCFLSERRAATGRERQVERSASGLCVVRNRLSCGEVNTACSSRGIWRDGPFKTVRVRLKPSVLHG